jgi:hypothetical protein
VPPGYIPQKSIAAIRVLQRRSAYQLAEKVRWALSITRKAVVVGGYPVSVSVFPFPPDLKRTLVLLSGSALIQTHFSYPVFAKPPARRWIRAEDKLKRKFHTKLICRRLSASTSVKRKNA